MQLEMFKQIDSRREYYLLSKYKKAVPVGEHSLSTIDLFLCEKGDFNTSINSIKRVMDTRENLLSRGFSFLSLLDKPTSYYSDWKARQEKDDLVRPSRSKARFAWVAPPKKEPRFVYDI